MLPESQIKIYDGTVKRILVINNFAIVGLETDALTLHWLQRIKNMTLSLGLDLEIGFLQLCNPVISGKNAGKNLETWKEFALISDFAICAIEAYSNSTKYGAKYTFQKIQPKILRYREKLKAFNSNIDVLFGTFWPTEAKYSYNRTLMKEYWIEADKFASHHKYPVFLPAFDNPNFSKLIGTLAHIGWWRLTRNDLSRNVSGYVETISEKPPSSVLQSTTIKNPAIKIDDNSSNYLAYGGILSVLAVIVGISLRSIWILHKKRRTRLSNLIRNRDIDNFFNRNTAYQNSENYFFKNETLHHPYDANLEIPKENLEISWNKVLGTGQYGCVFEAFIKNTEGTTKVALKTLKSDSPQSAMTSLLVEIKILTYLGKHDNIVSICGAYTTELDKGVVYLAIEYCGMGSLKDHLVNLRKSAGDNESQNEGKSNLVRLMYGWSHGIACGMEYLGRKGVVHADLAARNILLTIEEVAKITDFGLSKRLYEYEKYVKGTQEDLPWRWMAFETLKFGEFSTKSDVWSYGITLWEIFSLGDQPFPIHSWNDEFIHDLENGMRMEQPFYATSEMYQIMTRCWDLRRDGRPTFTDLKMLTNSERESDLYDYAYVI